MNLREYLASLNKVYRKTSESAEDPYVNLLEMRKNATYRVTMADNKLDMRMSGPIDNFFGVDVREMIGEAEKQMNGSKPESVKLSIEGPGGMANDGLYMHNWLRARSDEGAEVETRAMGTLASATSLVFLAGDKRIVSEGNRLMVHRPFGGQLSMGNWEEIQKDAQRSVNSLKSLEKTVYEVTAKQTGEDLKTVEQQHNDETWFSGQQIVDAGYATEMADASDGNDQMRLELTDQDFEVADTVLADMEKMITDLEEAA